MLDFLLNDWVRVFQFITFIVILLWLVWPLIVKKRNKQSQEKQSIKNFPETSFEFTNCDNYHVKLSNLKNIRLVRQENEIINEKLQRNIVFTIVFNKSLKNFNINTSINSANNKNGSYTILTNHKDDMCYVLTFKGKDIEFKNGVYKIEWNCTN